jgi:hypothetical protein
VAGYSSRSLAEKLGIGKDTTVVLIDGPPGYAALLGSVPPGAAITSRMPAAARFIHQFARRRADLETKLPRAARSLEDDGTLWISWPKKSSGVATDLTEDIVRAVGLPLGLVDVKVCAVDEIWSGLKFVRRKELRRVSRRTARHSQ